MDDKDVRRHAQDLCDALVAGDIDRAAGQMSNELRSNLGQLVGQLPLPLTEATVVSVERGGSGYTATLRLVGETAEIGLLTRWKDRDGRPTLVEASHVTETAVEPGERGGPGEAEPEA